MSVKRTQRVTITVTKQMVFNNLVNPNIPSLSAADITGIGIAEDSSFAFISFLASTQVINPSVSKSTEVTAWVSKQAILTDMSSLASEFSPEQLIKIAQNGPDPTRIDFVFSRTIG